MKIHLLNGALPFAHSEGRLNQTLFDQAQTELTDLGHEVTALNIRDGYDPDEEAARILQSDAILYQFPGWWMDVPWILKKYEDEVYTAGHGTLYRNDGRTRADPLRKYGSGGLLQGKKYMISTTWNAPLEAFDAPGQFFEGKGIDGLLLPFRKAQEFLGLSQLPTFMVNDAMKAPDVPSAQMRYAAHLKNVFGQAGS